MTVIVDPSIGALLASRRTSYLPPSRW